MPEHPLRRLVLAGLATAMIDGLFATVSSIWVFDSTFARLWQGVASTLLGPDAFTGGTRTVAIGLSMHAGVAFGWSAVFLLLLGTWPLLRRIRASSWGACKVAALYGPFIWLVMSLVVIPLLVGRPPAITPRWWVQLSGHIPFVGLPIALGIGRVPGRAE
jgi:hypothetical protein